MSELQELQSIFESYLQDQLHFQEPKNLYAPIKYTLENGGKRIRPLLTLMSAKSFGQDIKLALPAAAAIEVFHNFTLLHDDIMDQAPVRRGKPSVYKKWNENTAILSGDTMLILAYKLLEAYDGETFKQLNSLLNKTAIEVCEGQQMDMDFESKDIVAIEEYLQMIKLKTAVLLGAALKYGGILAKAKDSDLENIYNFGVHLGMAFQIQDDYLDTFGDQAVFGKRIGGDIIDRKKTFLFIKALQNADSKDQKYLLDLYKNNDIDEAELIEKTINFFKNQKVDKLAQAEIALYTNKAINNLKNTSLPDNEKNFWLQFANDLMYRQS